MYRAFPSIIIALFLIHIYIYTYIERERICIIYIYILHTHVCVYIYMYICVHIYIYIMHACIICVIFPSLCSDYNLLFFRLAVHDASQCLLCLIQNNDLQFNLFRTIAFLSICFSPEKWQLALSPFPSTSLNKEQSSQQF